MLGQRNPIVFPVNVFKTQTAYIARAQPKTCDKKQNSTIPFADGIASINHTEDFQDVIL